MLNKIVDIQRNIRANLSFFYNKKEKISKKEIKLINNLQKLANKILKIKKSNYKKTHKIFSEEILKLILKNKLLNFLQYSFIQKMFFVHNRLFLKKYLSEMQKMQNWNYWKRLLTENNIGNPVRYFLAPFTSGNKIFQVYHLKKYNDFLKKNLNDFDLIFEFGGGYGNMATIFNKINNKAKFVIFDTPEVNLLQYYYLKKNNLNVDIRLKKKNKNILLINSLNDLKKIVKKYKNKKKLFIANWSLSETPLSLRKKISFIFDNFDYQIISYQSNFEKIDNIKYFEKINIYNIKKNRNSLISNVPKIKNNYYLFSKI